MSEKMYHHGDLRNSLIEGGIELINQEGINGFSLRKVAALCGVSHAAPYSHFKNKEEMIDAIQEYVINNFMASFKGIIETYNGRQDIKLLIDLGKAYVMFFINNPKYFTFLFANPWMEINLSLKEDSTKNFPPFELFKKTAIGVMRANGFPEERLEDAIISSWATVHGLTAIATMPNVKYDKEWESKIEDIIWNK